PTVVRPSASVSDDTQSGQTLPAAVEWGNYIRWGLIAAVVLTAVGLASSVYVSYAESSRNTKLRSLWDEYHKAVFDKKSDEDRVDALEKLAADNTTIRGSGVHAHVLSSLAHANFEMAQSPRRTLESRAASLERAIQLNKQLAENEPFKSNPSFGPIAVQNLATAYEQKQVNEVASTKYYDDAIKTLRGAMYKDDAKEADPTKDMKSHFLFNKMTAQLGRLYWLRGLKKIELDANKSADAAKGDNDFALYYVKQALDSGISAVEKDRFGKDFKGNWREEAAYIKSLLEPIGKMMPGGVAPAMKLEAKAAVTIDAAPKGAVAAATTATITTTTPHKFVTGDNVIISGVAVAGYNGSFAVASVPTPNSFTYTVAAGLAASGGGSAEVKGDAKKEDVKKEEPKKDEKKAGALIRGGTQNAVAINSEAPAQHMSYAQIQAMLKQGRSAMCQCVRCVNPDKAIGAKLEE
ncbi:MAG: hypothetical protein WCT04_25025, partial [Planctomycetota bacterium]